MRNRKVCIGYTQYTVIPIKSTDGSQMGELLDSHPERTTETSAFLDRFLGDKI